ncbi:MAG: hypothetical protein PQJ60_10780 [Spirochaetales bacterium]|nr:hypothetical protein [Spirochaetales bacterium]
MTNNKAIGRNYIELKREGKKAFDKLNNLLNKGNVKSYHLGDALAHGDKGYYVEGATIYIMTIRRKDSNSYIPCWAIWKEFA